jgi:hypothetical protein
VPLYGKEAELAELFAAWFTHLKMVTVLCCDCLILTIGSSPLCRTAGNTRNIGIKRISDV